MPDLVDGESVEMQGSGAKPYVLKNVGGVYSCSCPAWRNQSIAIERRTCKHLRKYRGDDAEEARIGGALPTKPAKTASTGGADGDEGKEPPLLLAESWDNTLDLSGWWMSEKLDGVRAYWDGQQFLSRQGNLYHAPDWFIEGLPNVPLDGELWIDRKAFQRTVSIVRRQDRSDHWKTVRYVVFDAPQAASAFEDRVEFLREGVRAWMNPYVAIHEHSLCRDLAHLQEELRRVEALGGEGLMLRQPGSKYAAGRSYTLLKVKSFHDAEAVVIGHEAGKGRHQGRLGALTVRLPNGKTFSIGTGFSDRQREQPPPIGSLVQFRYQELTDAGIPRFPSYIGVRSDVAPRAHSGDSTIVPQPSERAIEISTKATPVSAPSKTSEPVLEGSRYFEFVEGKSSKFWEIATAGNQLTTRWGRIGSQGQSKTKTFSSAEEAWRERQAAIESKLAGGYQEIEVAPPAEPLPASARSIPTSAVGRESRDDETSEKTPDAFGIASEDADSSAEPTEVTAAALVDDPGSEGASESQTSTLLIHLQPADGEILRNEAAARRLSQQLDREGFSLIGDFSIQELPVLLRAFFRAPNVYAVLCELESMLWVDLSVRNADGTNEDWSNVPIHDGISPPWSTIVVKPDADLTELLAMMTAGRSGKEPARLSGERFASLYEDAFTRGMVWRASSQAEPPPSPTTVSQRIQDLVWAFAREYYGPRRLYKNSPPDQVPSGKIIFKLPPSERIEVIKAGFLLQEPIIDETRYDAARELREALLKQKLPFTDADIEFLAEEMAKEARTGGGIDTSVLGAIEQWRKSHPLSDAACTSLRQARDRTHAGFFNRDAHKLKARIDALVGDDDVRNPIKRREVWAAAAIDEVQQMPDESRKAWTRLLQHCVTANSGKPSQAWIAEAKSLIAKIGRPQFLDVVLQWFPLVDKPWPEPRFPRRNASDPLAIDEANQDILRGLVWCCGLEPDAATARAVGALGLSAYRKIRFVGARAVRVGNACVFTLGVMGDADAVAQLAILKVKVKFGTAQRFIHQELDKAAERLGLPREELEEMSVPAYGMEEIGMRRETLGDFTAELQVSTSGKVDLRWLKPDGTPQKSIPATVQKEFADEVKELKAAAKDIDKMLVVQRDRIDSQFLQPRTWSLSAWRDRYLDHPLVGLVARRVIWQFRSGDKCSAGIYHDGQLVGSDDQPLAFADDTTVELWHPIGHSVAEITSWRRWLERHEVQQPFKQAHREIYLLTDAEERTEVYSNRFAAHVLRQTQFRALASVRGWQSTLLGYWDGGDNARAMRRLPVWDLIAEFWVQGLPPETAEDIDNDRGGAGMTYIGTDQVRFCRADHPEEPIPLGDIPPLVFSEIMRDVDLFVGVASVGNDPTWMDGGPDRQYSDYWYRYSFGELSASARTRFEVLERLLPRLKIAGRCTLSDRFLVVQGDLRTYKIHLGSGNILMEPNDQYLCIVPKPTSGDVKEPGLFLPFEGDRTLSIILSKAFLLADDKKIKDPTITRQILESRS